MRWENKNTCQWPVLLVISVPKIFVNGQFCFNLSSKTWSHVFFGTQCIYVHTIMVSDNWEAGLSDARNCWMFNAPLLGNDRTHDNRIMADMSVTWWDATTQVSFQSVHSISHTFQYGGHPPSWIWILPFCTTHDCHFGWKVRNRVPFLRVWTP